MAKIGRIAFIAFLVAAPYATLAATISATVAPNPASVDDSVLLRIEVNGSGGSVGGPSFSAPDFTVVGNSKSVQSISRFEGGKFVVEAKHIFSIVLYPKSPGTHTISHITVPTENTKLQADDIIVQVRPGSGNPNRATPQTPGNPNDDEDVNSPPESVNNENALEVPKELYSDFTVFLALDKKSAYVGEPVIAEYWLYDYGNLVQTEIQKWPTFNGFWKEDLQIVTRAEFEPAFVGGKHVRRALLGRFALYGIKPGKIPLDKLVVNGVYISRNRPRNDDDDPFFSQFFGIQEQRRATHASQETVLEILPLPEQGRPANFGGAVGNFTASMTADKTTLDANTPLNMQVSFEGVGNFPAIDQPKLQLPPDFELFESNVNFKDSVPHGMRRPIANKKTFNYVVIPRKPGSYSIPPVEFSFFDPKKKSYQTIRTGEVKVQVTGSAAVTPQTSTPTQPSSGPTKAPEASLKPVEDLSHADWITKIVWALIAILGLLSLGLLAFNLRKIRLPKAPRSTKPKLDKRQLLKPLEANLDWRDFTGKFEETLHHVGDIVLGKTSLGMLREELEEAWKEKQLPAELFHRYCKLLDRVAALRYGNSDEGRNKAELLKELEQLLNDLQKAL